MATRADPRWTFEDYFAWEATQELRHEFIDGDVYAMTGGTLRHSRVIVRLSSALDRGLRGQSCVPFQGDAKLLIEATGNSFYPDALVCCDAAAMQERGVLTDATAVFEVLSPTTALYNRSGKFANYRRLPGLKHYVLVDPEALTVEVFDLIEGRWTIADDQGDEIVLTAIGLRLSKLDLFEGLGEPRAAIGSPVPPGNGHS